MSFFCRLSRKHYWCTPHRSEDRRLVQVCYECGGERTVHDFQDDVAAERLNHALSSARTEAARLSSSQSVESSGSASLDLVAVGQGRSHKFLLVK
jgi:hypothetical protein